MNTKPRVLVAGVGNVFFGDDGFGCEVARRLRELPLPQGVRVVDYGIRGIHLAYDLLDGVDLLVVADAVSRGGLPGTLYVIEPDVVGFEATESGDPHGMDVGSVFASIQAMGGKLSRTLIVGCEPSGIDERLGLSEPVTAAIDEAVKLIREILERELGELLPAAQVQVKVKEAAS